MNAMMHNPSRAGLLGRVRLCACLALLLGSYLLLTGCTSGIEDRIAQHHEAFSAYPAEVQERIRQGKIRLGDDTETVWLVYGEPKERLRRLDANGTTEVWIYKILGYNERLYPTVRPVYRDVRGTIHGSYYLDDTPEYEWKEALRIEFTKGRVSAVQQQD